MIYLLVSLHTIIFSNGCVYNSWIREILIFNNVLSRAVMSQLCTPSGAATSMISACPLLSLSAHPAITLLACSGFRPNSRHRSSKPTRGLPRSHGCAQCLSCCPSVELRCFCSSTLVLIDTQRKGFLKIKEGSGHPHRKLQVSVFTSQSAQGLKFNLYHPC